MRAPLRSARAWLAAALTGALLFAYVTVTGLPGWLAAIASLGTTEVEARGGLVVDVRLPDELGARKAAETLRTIDARFTAAGAHVDRADPLATRFAIAGVALPDAQAVALASRPGRLEFRAIATEGPLVHAIAVHQPTVAGVTRDTDSWSVDDGVRHAEPILRAPSFAALRDEVATLPTDPDSEIRYDETTTEHPRSKSVDHFFQTHVVVRTPILDSRAIASANVGWDELTDQPIVQVAFTPDGAQTFGDFTASHVGTRLAIMVDDRLLSAPTINSPIRGGRVQITVSDGPPAQQLAEAEAMAHSLAAGLQLPDGVRAEIIARHPGAAWRELMGRLVAGLFAAIVAMLLAWPLTRWPDTAQAQTHGDWPVAAIARHGAPRAPRMPGDLLIRLTVTLCVPIGLWALGQILLPGLDEDGVAGLLRGAGSRALRIGALGIGPIVLGFVLIELAALIIPAWRRRRLGDRAQRAPLRRAAVVLITALATIQAWFVVGYLSTSTGPYDPPLTDSAVIHGLALALLVGTVGAYAIGAALVERFGVGAGWSVVVGGAAAVDLIQTLAAARGDTALLLGAEIALVAALVAFATRTRIGRARLPLGGLLGAGVVTSLAGLALVALSTITAGSVALYRVQDLLADPRYLFGAAIVGGAGLGALWSRGQIGHARVGAIALSAAIGGGLTLIAAIASAGAGVSLTAQAALVTVVALDLATEVAARRRADRWVPVEQLHDIDAIDDAVASGGAWFARGAHHRALFRIFAPYVPVTIYEPEIAPPR